MSIPVSHSLESHAVKKIIEIDEKRRIRGPERHICAYICSYLLTGMLQMVSPEHVWFIQFQNMLTISMAHYSHNYVKWEVSKWDYNFEMDSRCDQKATEL